MFPNDYERPHAMTAALASMMPQVALPLTSTRHDLVRHHAATVLFPLRRILSPLAPQRLRWDVLNPGPVTPLSPNPSANTFSNWIVPKPAPFGNHIQLSIPLAAAYIEPESPTLSGDIETRDVCNRLKKDIESKARRHCLTRFKQRISGYSDFIPATMIKPEDTLQAALEMMDSHCLKLKDFIVEDLPYRLQSCATAEAELRKHFCINFESELKEQNEWMNHVATTTIFYDSDVDEHTDHEPQTTALAVSILDEQREVFHHLREQRESENLFLESEALEAAWAVKMLDDAERRTQTESDDSDSSSDVSSNHDGGYSYGNILRIIESDMKRSASSGTLASVVNQSPNSDFASMRSRSSTWQSTSSNVTRDSRFPQRSSLSPSKESRWSERLSGSTVPSSNTYASSFCTTKQLRILTETIQEPHSSELSPADREFRHRGPNLAELGTWAQELKKMEAMQADRQRSPTIHSRAATRGGSSGLNIDPRTPTRQVSVDSINTRISPTRTVHSRFSSSSSGSSSSTITSRTLPRPQSLKHSPSSSFSTLGDTRPTMLDHEYHQRKMKKSSLHKRSTSKTSTRNSLRHNQHLRASSTVQILATSAPKPEEDGWMGELKRMEMSERVRQAEEKRRVAELLRGDTLIGEEDVLGEGK